MARTDTLGHFLTDVADAIREKTGSSDTITASDFDTEIENIPSAGGGQIYYTAMYGDAGQGTTTLTVNLSQFLPTYDKRKTVKKGIVAMFVRSDYTVSNNVEVLYETDFLTATDSTRQKLIVGWCNDMTQNITLTQQNSSRLAIYGMLLEQCKKPTNSNLIINATTNTTSFSVTSTNNLCLYFVTGAYQIVSSYSQINPDEINIYYDGANARLGVYITCSSGNKTIPFDGNGSAIIGIELEYEAE